MRTCGRGFGVVDIGRDWDMDRVLVRMGVWSWNLAMEDLLVVVWRRGREKAHRLVAVFKLIWFWELSYVE